MSIEATSRWGRQMAKTRKSTPKYEVYHIISGQVVLGGVSKTEAAQFAASMDEGRTGKARFATRRQDKPLTTNQLVAMFAQVLTA